MHRHDNLVKSKVVNRRNFILIIAQSILCTVIIIRLFILQILNYRLYKIKSNINHRRIRLDVSNRMSILDRTNRPMAYSKQRYHFELSYVEGYMKSLRTLATLMGLEPELIDRFVNNESKRLVQNNYMPIILQLKVNEATAFKIIWNTVYMPGIDLNQHHDIRIYPLGLYASHIVGYVAQDLERKSEIEDTYSIIHVKHNVICGMSGLEKVYNTLLSGDPGVSIIEIDNTGHHKNIIEHKKPKPGHNIHTTINYDLQELAGKLMTNQSGCIIVSDVQTGGILAMHSAPSFDPLNVKEYINDPSHPLINRAVSSLYSPGSVFKLPVALAILEAGINPNELFRCDQKYLIGNRYFHCLHNHGDVNLYTAIAGSCNCYFYHYTRKMSIDQIVDAAKKMRLNTKPELQIGHEPNSVMPDRAWRLKRKDKWYAGNTALTSIGHGELMFTPMQLCTMTSILATGKYIKPSLIKEKIGNAINVNIDNAHLQILHKAMNMVFTGSNGTCRWYRRQGTEYMAGKTGTSQLQSTLRNKMTNTDPTNALFTAFAPLINPRFSVLVITERGVSGSIDAMPTAYKLLTYAMNNNCDESL